MAIGQHMHVDNTWKMNWIQVMHLWGSQEYPNFEYGVGGINGSMVDHYVQVEPVLLYEIVHVENILISAHLSMMLILQTVPLISNVG